VNRPGTIEEPDKQVLSAAGGERADLLCDRTDPSLPFCLTAVAIAQIATLPTAVGHRHRHRHRHRHVASN
jgi:hypothetical protein